MPPLLADFTRPRDLQTNLRIILDTTRINFALRVLDGFSRLCCWVDKGAQTDRPLAPSKYYEYVVTR